MVERSWAFAFSFMIKVPCKRDCAKRSPTCHSECEDYILYAKLKAEEREIRSNKSAEYNLDRYLAVKNTKRRRA